MQHDYQRRRIYAINLKLGFKRAIKGIDYFRMMEYPLVFSQLELKKKDTILDVGSSDSIFPIFLAYLGHKVYSIDIDPKVLNLKNYAKRIGDIDLTVDVQDVTKLRYPDNFFDKITAISTLEHVLPIANGDVRAMGEISRTLKNGGQAVITVPYNKRFMIEWSRKKIDGHFSVIRKYDESSIYDRLVKPSSGLRLTNRIFFAEFVKFSKIWYKSPFCIFAFASPFFAKFFINFGVNIDRPQGVCLCFKKY
ncbi:MAG: class I SAM-dependent methyltransferase [Candidatus Bathyarchaeia archaeon]